MPRAIAFLSLTGFYAGAARRLYGLAGPVLVGHRGRLKEASPELRLAGLQPGLSRREAAYAAPEAQWVDYEPQRFRPLAEAFWQCCGRLTPQVEPLDDHEVFLDLTGVPDVPSPAFSALAAALRRVLGIPELELQAGLAANRLVARLAAGEAGERGCLVVAPGEEADFLAPLPPSALWTIPAPMRETLSRLGLAALAEVRAIPEPALRRLFGPDAHLLLRHAWGQDDSPVSLLDQTASRALSSLRWLERQAAFPLPSVGWPAVASFLQEAATSLAAELRETGQSVLRLQLTLELAGGRSRQARSTPREPPATAGALYATLAETARRLWEEAGTDAPLQRMRVRVEAVDEAGRTPEQLALLPAGAPPAPRPRALAEVLAAVNRAFSAEVLFPAARLELSRRERFRRLRPEFGYAAP